MTLFQKLLLYLIAAWVHGEASYKQRIAKSVISDLNETHIA